MKLTVKKINLIQEEILTWYEMNKRDLPWRKTRDPYAILVSEIMSQQTQISRVVPKFETWMTRFPTIQSLAEAQTREVLQYWSGLGYNRRAINLQKTAHTIVYEYKGNFPQSVDALKKLPGIGEYTASAIACFAFDQQIAVVDTNVRKVILTKVYSQNEAKARASNSRYHQEPFLTLPTQAINEKALSHKEIKEIATKLLPKGKAYEWNQALMDYASAMLKKEKIPVAKQSTFKGSNRYYRGQAIKYLIERKEVTLEDLGRWLVKDIHFVEELVQKLERDGLVVLKKDQISLP